MGNQETADATTYLADITAALSAEWPANRTVNIVCHGHSVPSGYFKTPLVDTFNAYPHLLHVALKRRFPNAVINVIVTGIGGENSASGSERFASDVLCHKPDLVTIDYSLNDRTIGLEKARAAWSSVIEKCLSERIKVILLTPTPDSRSDQHDPQDPLCRHAEQVRSLAATYHVGLADSLKGYMSRVQSAADLAALMSHVNHPNRAGHDIVAAELLKWFP